MHSGAGEVRDDCSGHIEGTDPRRRGRCVKCGAVMLTPNVTPLRPRDVGLEHELTETAAQSVGVRSAVALSLSRLCDQRAHPGGIRLDADFNWEAIEEASDGRNYCVFRIMEVHAAYLRGDEEAARVFSKHMRALAGFLLAYEALMSN